MSNTGEIKTLVELTCLSLTELRDKRLKDKYRKKAAQGQAHVIALLIERVCALWGYINVARLGEHSPRAFKDYELQRMAGHVGMMSLSALAIYSKSGRYSALRDYPTLRPQLPGAAAAGLERGLKEDYDPLLDLEILAYDEAGRSLVRRMINEDADNDPVDRAAQQLLGRECIRLCTLGAIRRRLIWMLVSVEENTCTSREYELIDALLSKICPHSETELSERLAAGRKSRESRRQAVQSRQDKAKNTAPAGPDASALKVGRKTLERLDEILVQLLMSHDIIEGLLSSQGFDQSNFALLKEYLDALNEVSDKAENAARERLIQQLNRPSVNQVLNNFSAQLDHLQELLASQSDEDDDLDYDLG